MNGWLLAVVGTIYLACSVNYWRDGDAGMALAFAAYALANVGFILAGVRL
jgi:hypothetical protein